MTSFTFNVISEKDDKRIPISVAGQVMVDVQDLFRHIGEYIISREMRFQEAVPAKLAEKFTIYADKSGGVVLEASTEGRDPRIRQCRRGCPHAPRGHIGQSRFRHRGILGG
ncbi:MAG: hypothetical protein IJL79_00970 [Candidatus Methanomethylophilaceae archaeon]|nr:hypothetical protein [Candidatus Methanomethylophilaceae archaeon]